MGRHPLAPTAGAAATPGPTAPARAACDADALPDGPDPGATTAAAGGPAVHTPRAGHTTFAADDDLPEAPHDKRATQGPRTARRAHDGASDTHDADDDCPAAAATAAAATAAVEEEAASTASH